jgi:hypothetical protein
MPFLYFAERTRHSAVVHDERLDSVSFRPRPVWLGLLVVVVLTARVQVIVSVRE